MKSIYSVLYNGIQLYVMADSQQEAEASVGDKPIIFISYKKMDNTALTAQYGVEVRDKIVEMILSSASCAVWVDTAIIGATEWNEENIMPALKACAMMVLLISKNVFDPNGFIASREIPAVNDRTGLNGKKIPIYPIVIDSELINDLAKTWERVEELTTRKGIQGTVLLNFGGNSEQEKQFSVAIKKAVGELPDVGISGRIQRIDALLRNNDFATARNQIKNLRSICPERYEPYWFNVRTMTKNFSTGDVDHTAVNSEFVMAKKYAQPDIAKQLQNTFDKYIVQIIKHTGYDYSSYKFMQGEPDDFLTLLSYLSEDAIKDDYSALSNIATRYAGQMIKAARQEKNKKLVAFCEESKPDSPTIHVNDKIKQYGGYDSFEMARLNAYIKKDRPVLNRLSVFHNSPARSLIANDRKLSSEFDEIYNVLNSRVLSMERYRYDFADIVACRNDIVSQNEVTLAEYSDCVMNGFGSSVVLSCFLYSLIPNFCLVASIYDTLCGNMDLIEGIAGGTVSGIISILICVFLGKSISEDNKVKKKCLHARDLVISTLHTKYPYLPKLASAVPQLKGGSLHY